MAYLVGAIALSAFLAWLVVWWHRRPKSMAKGIDEFYEARQAIAPRAGERPARPPAPGDDEPRSERGSPSSTEDGEDDAPGRARRSRER